MAESVISRWMILQGQYETFGSGFYRIAFTRLELKVKELNFDQS